MERRSLYYWAREYTGSIVSGQNYKELPDIIVINILDFIYIPLEDFHTSFHLREDHHQEYKLTNAQEVHFLEMAKFRTLENYFMDGTKIESASGRYTFVRGLFPLYY